MFPSTTASSSSRHRTREAHGDIDSAALSSAPRGRGPCIGRNDVTLDLRASSEKLPSSSHER
jgi:hypothetical protein